MGIYSELARTWAAAMILQLPILLPGLVFIAAIKRRWLMGLNRPIDGGTTFRGQPLLGPNKTWRAPFFYIVGATVVSSILHFVAPAGLADLQVFKTSPLLLGPAIGASYSLGELINSFAKRRLAVGSGAEGITPLARNIQRAGDTVDGAITSGLAYLVFGVSWQILAASLVLTVIFHSATDAVMRRLGLKQDHK